MNPLKKAELIDLDKKKNAQVAFDRSLTFEQRLVRMFDWIEFCFFLNPMPKIHDDREGITVFVLKKKLNEHRMNLSLLTEAKSLFTCFEKNQVEYLIIGGVAVNIHGFQRATGDLDLWFNPTKENFQLLLNSLKELGFDCSDIERSDQSVHEKLIRLPLNSFSVEFLPFLDGKGDFKTIQQRSISIMVDGVNMRVIGYDDLIACKANLHRAKDLEDIAQLEKRKRQELDQ